MNKNHLLEIQTGKHKGRKIRITDAETIIGRAESAKIRIGSDDVSRHHCVLIVRGNEVFVRDLESRNGTFVNGRPIEGELPLRPGSTLAVGPMVLRLLGDEEESSSVEVRIVVKSPAQIAEPLSDDDIAAWLSDDAIKQLAGSDTATFDAPTKISPPLPVETTPASPPPGATPRKREFASVAEEARDIIRRYREGLQQDS